MKLVFAQRCAERLTEWLDQFAERVEVAGSVRRRRSEVNDIDLVVIPKVHTERDMFGISGPTRNTTWIEIDRRATADNWEVLRAGTEIVSWRAKGVQVDLFWATPDNWGTTLMCRTGSKEHNIWLCNYAIAQRGKWHPSVGLYMGNHRYSDTEEAIYGALGVSYIPPENREAHLLPFAGLIRHNPSTLSRMS